VSTQARAVITDSIFAFNSAAGVSVDAVANAVTYMHVDRSVLADNIGDGLAHNGVNLSFVNILVMRSAIHRNLGSEVDARGPGYVVVSENGILSNGVGIRGENGAVYANANTVVSQNVDFVQLGAASFYSYGNNAGPFSSLGAINSTTGN